MNIRFHSARIVPSVVRTETPYVVKANTGSKVKDWFFNLLWSRFEKWGNIKKHFDEVTIETFDFTESKQKTITNRILEELEKRRYDYRENPAPETHVIVMGEDTFFDILDEKAATSPFFGTDMSFMSNEMYYTDPYGGRSALQFSCHVVPGMQGFAFIPKVFIEVKK